ncbi:MAG: hypothetical protein KAT46_07810 [Deltaproteobacteria bacterium]|nr:hypothetical protein [Deltaproteobacteria bacterium]
MGGSIGRDSNYSYEPWYKYGLAFLYFEMLIAVGVTIFSLYMAFTGKGGVLGSGH